MKKGSRLDKISRRHYEKNILFILIAIIIILVVFFVYGVPLLIKYSVFIGGIKNSDDKYTSKTNSSYIAPPVLDPLPSATNKEKITVSGSAQPKQTIKLYINGKYVDKVTVNENGSFSFENALLDEGDNNISAKSLNLSRESDYSQNVSIKYIDKLPSLDINKPNDQQIISQGDSHISVEGKTDPDALVSINDYQTIVDNDGNFSYLLNLQKGENKIKVVATDEAGNKTIKELSVTLNQ